MLFRSNLDVLSVLAGEGGYKAFKLVDGQTVSQVYANRTIENQITHELTSYSFPYHSAGPFGDDIDGEWLTLANFLMVFGLAGLGWKDIHAAYSVDPDPAAQPQTVDLLGQLVTTSKLIAYTRKRVVSACLTRLRRLFDRSA